MRSHFCDRLGFGARRLCDLQAALDRRRALSERAQTQQKNGVRVNAAVLSEKESRAAFGVPLYSKEVQPIN